MLRSITDKGKIHDTTSTRYISLNPLAMLCFYFLPNILATSWIIKEAWLVDPYVIIFQKGREFFTTNAPTGALVTSRY